MSSVGNDENRAVVVIGASAAGLRCASRLKRLRPDWSVTVVEARASFSYAACGMPYVLSGDIDDVDILRTTASGMVRDERYFEAVKGLKMRTSARVMRIHHEKRTVTLESAEGEEELAYDDLVIATGARARHLPNQPVHPRICCFHVPEDLRRLHEGLARGRIKKVAIIGAGPVGCELAEAFTAVWGAQVSLLEAGEHPLPNMLDAEVAYHVTRSLTLNGVAFYPKSTISQLIPSDNGVKVVLAEQTLEVDVAVVCIGVTPAVELARDAGAALGSTGAIKVDPFLRTSLPNIYAAGDCVELTHRVDGRPFYLPQGSLANRMGRTLGSILSEGDAPLDVKDYENSRYFFPPAAGASAVKVFDLNIASVGLTREQVDRGRPDSPQGMAIWVLSYDRADYYPEASKWYIQLVYDRSSSPRLLGLQVAGRGAVNRLVDIATQLIHQGISLQKAANYLEHAYTPPLSMAMDPLLTAINAALNHKYMTPPAAQSPLCPAKDDLWLDVRHPEEAAARPALRSPTAKHIPLEELRERMDEIRGGHFMPVCEHGPRAAEAARLICPHTESVSFLAGGLQWTAGEES